MVLYHYCYYTKDFTDDLLSHILSYCNYNDVHHVVTMLQEQQPPRQRLLLSGGGDSYSPQENDGHKLYHNRWQNLHVWYELMLRDGYAPPDGSGSNKDHDGLVATVVDGTTNFWKLYEYRKKLLQNLFGISTGNNVTATATTITSWSDRTTTNNNDEITASSKSSSKVTDQTTSIVSIPIETTMLSPKFIAVSDLLLSSSTNIFGFENHDRKHLQHFEQYEPYDERYFCFNPKQIDEYEDFEFHLISEATGASLLTLDSRYCMDESSLVSNLRLFPNLLEPSHYCTAPSLDVLCMNDDSNNSTTRNISSQEQYQTQPHSMNLYRHVIGNIYRPTVLPCQQLVSQDGRMYTIIGCATEDNQCIELRFWRITFVSHNRSTSSREAERTPLHQSTGISVERYGFCRIPLADIHVNLSLAYHYPTANNYSSCHRSDSSEYVDRPRVFICVIQEDKNVVAAYRIHPWREDYNINDLDDTCHIDNNECMTMIHDAEYVHELENPYRHDPRVLPPRIAGKALLSDGSTILVIYLNHDIQLWNMTTTTITGTPNITCINALEAVRNLIKTYFPPHTILYDAFVSSASVDHYYLNHNSTDIGKKTLPIDIYGFFTFNLMSTASRKSLQLYWEFDFVTLSWRISSIIILPVIDERLHCNIPSACHYDGQKLVVLGRDNLGYIILIYQILLIEDGDTAQNSDDALNKQSCVHSNLRQRFEESGGVYNFPYDSVHGDNDISEDGAPLRTPIRRQRRKIQFKRRIRHESFGVGRAGYKMDMVDMLCNERFILVRIADDKIDSERIISFDLDSSEFDV